MKKSDVSNFAVFILSHGRADNIKTIKLLRDRGYTGRIVIVIDNIDKTAERYYQVHGRENVVMFDKQKMADETDAMDNFKEMRTILYARNYSFKLAEELGLDYFLELDDDYTSFEFRYIVGDKLKVQAVKDLDSVFRYFLEYLEVSGSQTIAMAQGGDFIGGAKGGVATGKPRRKAMNTFFCKTTRPFKFIGTINEDTNTYVTLGSQGKLFLQVKECAVVQTATQQNTGGLTEYYLDNGTYVKSFYSVMAMPSAVEIRSMGTNHKRLHHSVRWNRAVPKIIDEQYKKGVRE